jgi:hypothetical protein
MDTSNMSAVRNLSSADYSTIESRVKAFRSDHPNGQILTEIVKDNESNGEVIFKAHAVVDNLIRATSHAMEVRGTSNINKTSHLEYAETNAIGRVLGMMGYLSNNQLESDEELENAKLQGEELKKKERKLKADISSLSIKYKKAIDEKNEVAIEECRQEMYDNPNLSWTEVNKLLSTKQLDYIYRLNEKARNEREIKEVMREASIKKAARERRKKYLNG